MTPCTHPHAEPVMLHAIFSLTYCPACSAFVFTRTDERNSIVVSTDSSPADAIAAALEDAHVRGQLSVAPQRQQIPAPLKEWREKQAKERTQE